MGGVPGDMLRAHIRHFLAHHWLFQSGVLFRLVLGRPPNSAEYYNKGFARLPLVTPYVPEYNRHTYHLYTLRVPSGAAGLVNFLSDNDIESRAYYPVPLHLQKCYKDLGYGKGSLPESEKASVETAAIPIFPELTLQQKEKITSAVKMFFEKHR